MRAEFWHNDTLTRRISMTFCKSEGYIVADQLYKGLVNNEPYWQNTFLQSDKLQHVARALFNGRVMQATNSNGN